MSKRNHQDFLNSCPEGRRLGKDYLRLGGQGQGQSLGKLWAPPSDPWGCEANSSLGQTTWGAVLQRAYPWGLAPLLSLSLPLRAFNIPFRDSVASLPSDRKQTLPLRSWPRSAFRHFGGRASVPRRESGAPPLASGWGAVIGATTPASQPGFLQPSHCTLSTLDVRPYLGPGPFPGPGRTNLCTLPSAAFNSPICASASPLRTLQFKDSNASLAC